MRSDARKAQSGNTPPAQVLIGRLSFSLESARLLNEDEDVALHLSNALTLVEALREALR